MDVGQTVPGNVAGLSINTGKRVNIPVTFKSQQVKGKAPALLGLPALIQIGAMIDCRNHKMTIWVDGEDVVGDLILTKSGHYILPLDGFSRTKADLGLYDQGSEKVALHVEEPTEASLEEIYEVELKNEEP